MYTRIIPSLAMSMVLSFTFVPALGFAAVPGDEKLTTDCTAFMAAELPKCRAERYVFRKNLNFQGLAMSPLQMDVLQYLEIVKNGPQTQLKNIITGDLLETSVVEANYLRRGSWMAASSPVIYLNMEMIQSNPVSLDTLNYVLRMHLAELSLPDIDSVLLEISQKFSPMQSQDVAFEYVRAVEYTCPFCTSVDETESELVLKPPYFNLTLRIKVPCGKTLSQIKSRTSVLPRSSELSTWVYFTGFFYYRRV